MDVLVTVVPVVLMLVLGKVLSMKQMISKETVTGIKGLISDIMLPVVIFNALLTASFDRRSFTLSLVVYALFSVFFFAGRALFKDKFNFSMSPFLLIGCEGGMLGYSLYTSLYGAEALSTLMELDLGNILFAFTFFIVTIQMANSDNNDTKAVIINSLKSPLVSVVAAGLILNVLGFGSMLMASKIGVLYSALVSMITSPLTALILLCVGYELSFEADLMGDVVKVSVIRMVMSGIIGALLLFVARPLIISRALFVAVLLYVCLPPQFITPIFIKDDREAQFAATTLSFYTVVTIIAYICIAAFVPLV